jgi:DNA-binding beta-propeller fold protein YncE
LIRLACRARRKKMRIALPLAILAALPLAACGTTGGPGADPRSQARVRAAAPAAPVPAGRTPISVVAGPEGVWVLDQARGRLSRHDETSARRIGSAVPVGDSPLALAAGAGSVWVLDARTGVQRVDLSTGRPAGRPVPVPDPSGIAVGAGAVWVTSRSARTLTRIDATSLRADPPVRLRAAPGEVVFAAGGAWVAQADAGSVVRIDATTRKAGPALRLSAGQVLALAADGGSVYAAVSKTALNDELEIVKIDQRSRKVTGDPVSITGGIPLRLAAGGGDVWATDVGSSLPGSPARAPGLLRADEASGRARPVAAIPGRPSAVASGPGAVWVTDSTAGTLTRIALR